MISNPAPLPGTHQTPVETLSEYSVSSSFQTSAKQPCDRGCDSQTRPRLGLSSQRQGATKTLSATKTGHYFREKNFQVISNKFLELPRNFVFMTISGSHPCCIDYGTFFVKVPMAMSWQVPSCSACNLECYLRIGMITMLFCISIVVVKWLEFGIEQVELNEPTLPKRHDKYSESSNETPWLSKGPPGTSNPPP